MACLFACFHHRKRNKRDRFSKLVKQDTCGFQHQSPPRAGLFADSYRVGLLSTPTKESRSASSLLFSPFRAIAVDHGSQKIVLEERDELLCPWSKDDDLNEQVENISREFDMEVDDAKDLTSEVALEKLNDSCKNQNGSHDYALEPFLSTNVQPIESSDDENFSCRHSSVQKKSQKLSENRGFHDSRPVVFKESVGLLLNEIEEHEENTSWPNAEMTTQGGEQKCVPSLDVYEDLLSEHIDVSSLIPDSELITNWERSFGRDSEENESEAFEDTAQSHIGVCHNAAEAENGLVSKPDIWRPKKQKVSRGKAVEPLTRHVCEVRRLNNKTTGSLLFAEGRGLTSSSHSAHLQSELVEDGTCEEPSENRTLSFDIESVGTSERSKVEAKIGIEVQDLTAGHLDHGNLHSFNFSLESSSSMHTSEHDEGNTKFTQFGDGSSATAPTSEYGAQQVPEATFEKNTVASSRSSAETLGSLCEEGNGNCFSDSHYGETGSSYSVKSYVRDTSGNSIHTHLLSSKFVNDRPILGTVAAHWSPVATKKWWDGKGIPNSTTKYKEDQRVLCYSLSFEERLEQALERCSKAG